MRTVYLCRAAFVARGVARLDRVPDLRRQIRAVEPSDLLDAGWRGHVDFGDVIADYVDADKQEALLAQCRADRGTDVALARGQLGFERAAADMQIGARLALGRPPQHRAGGP